MKKNKLINKIASKMRDDTHLLSEDLYGYDLVQGDLAIDSLLQVMDQEMLDWDFDDPEFIEAIISVYGKEMDVDSLLVELASSDQPEELKSIIFRMSGKSYRPNGESESAPEQTDQFVIGGIYNVKYKNYAGVDQIYEGKRLHKIKQGKTGSLLVFADPSSQRTYVDKHSGQKMLAKQFALNKLDYYKRMLNDLNEKHLNPDNRSTGISYAKGKVDRWLKVIKFGVHDKFTLNSSRIVEFDKVG